MIKSSIMKTTIRTAILLLSVLFFQSDMIGQVVNTIDIHLNIQEKVGKQISPMSDATLSISDIGEIKTDSDGKYKFTYPVRNDVEPKIAISLKSEEHQMLKPLDGSFELDTTQQELFVEFLVVNMAEESPEFKKRIEELEGRVRALRNKNQLTLTQLNALNQTLLDTIIFFEQNRQELESKIADYESLTSQQQSEISQLRGQITTLEDQVDQLTRDLEVALEEQYLRQNEQFREISSNLLAYLRKAKDIRDHMPYISSYYSSPSGYQNYDKDIRGYNEVYESFDDNRLSYLEGVDRYWEDKTLSRKLEETFSFLSKSIHQSQILTVVRDINTELHRQKPRKAQKIATISHDDMVVNIRALEKQVNRILTQMRKSI